MQQEQDQTDNDKLYFQHVLKEQEQKMRDVEEENEYLRKKLNLQNLDIQDLDSLKDQIKKQ